MENNITPNCLGTKHSHDCDKFVQLVQLILDDEATEEDKNFFKTHYDYCSPCSEHFKIEKSVLDTVRQKLSKAPAPVNLAEDIRSKINAFIQAPTE